jgi:hypothetical protein
MAPDPAEELALWRYQLITEALHRRLGSRERGVISTLQFAIAYTCAFHTWGRIVRHGRAVRSRPSRRLVHGAGPSTRPPRLVYSPLAW